MLNGLDLFSGIGGITLALAPWVKPVAYCERERYAQSVLLSRMASGDLPIAPIWDDVETLDAAIIGMPVDIIYGGFPCQDISAAGRGRGLDGERSGLVFEIFRLAFELEPTFVFLENVPAIRTRGGERVGKELAGLGYDLRWDVLSAFDVGAPHLRHRWFALACRNGGRDHFPHGHGHGHGLRDGRQRDTEGDAAAGFEPANDGSEKPLADTMCEGLEIGKPWNAREFEAAFGTDWWQFEPDVGRVAHGIHFRVDRLRGLGNSVVPAQAREAFKRLAGIR